MTRSYAHLEELFGLICTALSLVSLAAYFGALSWVGVLFLWMGSGLWAVHWSQRYPRLTVRPFARGLFSAGLGALWPLWLLHQRKPPQGSHKPR